MRSRPTPSCPLRSRSAGRGACALAIVLAAATVAAGEITPTRPLPPPSTPAAGSRLEVAPTLLWVVTDDAGRHETRVRYRPCVVAAGRPFPLDFSRAGERDAVRADVTVTRIDDDAQVVGWASHETQLGVTTDEAEPDAALHATTARRYVTSFRGRRALGRELVVPIGEDVDDRVSLVVVVRSTDAPTARCTNVPLGEAHPGASGP